MYTRTKKSTQEKSNIKTKTNEKTPNLIGYSCGLSYILMWFC